MDWACAAGAAAGVGAAWARLLGRVLKSELAQCPRCGGELRIVATILEQQTIEHILGHLKLPTRAPPRMPALPVAEAAAWAA